MTPSDPALPPDAADEPAPPVAAALAAQRAVLRTLFAATTRDWIELDLSMGQLKALMALATRRGLNVGGLADLLQVGNPAASTLVDRLVQAGYVVRTEDADDRRRTLLATTPAGDELVSRLRQGAGEIRVRRWLERMDPDDLAALTRGLEALAAIAARDGAPAAGPPHDYVGDASTEGASAGEISVQAT
jgi:DNA-binding MarR family transcriptional regulator